MADNQTIFQRLNNIFRSPNRNSVPDNVITSPSTISDYDRVIYSTNDKAEYERKLAALRQQKYLSYQWKKAEADNALESLAGYNAVKLMYRDVDLMDGCPEIATALDIISEEACPIDSKGKMLHIYSRSKRTKALLEDLFVNRLHIYTELPMIARHLCKYGNTFELLNISKENGVMGWMMLPVYEVDRDENGYSASYATIQGTNDLKPDEVKFIWRGHNGDNPYMNWQIAHFRMLEDSFFLPYGVSMLHKARRAWRMWSMMEDAMLIWRLDKAIERRVYKIYVGNIDDADVEAYVNQIANNFKRTPIIDPKTGQVDLRKNFLDVSSDYFIPVRREDAPNPIETLQAANSQVQMEDLEYMQLKMLTAMRVPKVFLNFQDAQGKGQNLSFVDVRFSRMINRIQQFLLMEMNKIAMIHLYIMGLTDEIGNFTLTLNNPSSQIETQELTDLTARINAMQTAVSDPGTGIPMMSMHKALRDIMKMSDEEIKDMLNEIRLEKAMAAELAATANIIKKTGIFDTTDRIYGDYEAMNSNQPAQPAEGEDEMGGGEGGLGGLGGGLGGDMGGMDDMDMDLGEPGSEGGADLGGEGETDMGSAPEADAGSPLMEAVKKKKPSLKEIKRAAGKTFTEQYFEMLSESAKNEDEEMLDEPFDFEGRTVTIQENIKKVLDKFENLVDEDALERETILEDAITAMDPLSGETEETQDNVIDDGLKDADLE